MTQRLNPPEAAAFLKVSVSRIHQMMKAKTLKFSLCECSRTAMLTKQDLLDARKGTNPVGRPFAKDRR